MNKQDWIEYFEAINGRTPSEAEVAQGLAAGEFVAEDVAAAPEQVQPVAPQEPVAPQPAQAANSAEAQAEQMAQTQAPIQPQAGQESVQAAAPQDFAEASGQAQAMPSFQNPQADQASQFAQVQQGSVQAGQPMSGQFTQPGQVAQPQQQVYYQQGPDGQVQAVMAPAPKQPNPQVEAFKKGFKDYFAWFLKGFKNPQAKEEEAHPVFGLVTIGLASWFISWGLVNFFHRLLMMFPNATADGESFKEADHEAYKEIVNSISSHFGFLKTFAFIFIFFVFYVLVMGAPAIFDKDKTKTFFKKFGQYFSYSPIVLVLNILAFFSSFIVTNQLDVDTSAMDAFDTSDSLFGSFGMFAKLEQALPALKTITVGGGFVTFFVILGLLFIFVALLKNINLSLKKVNNFYMSVLVGLVFALVLFIVYKISSSMIIGGLRDILTELSSNFF
ncbi:hypothetical protein ACFSN5_02990 [Streptococcus tangpeifui]|uniref:hypothetical protein n=1 Tax=Streptococcus tangpeifui TaxID=2709400 RepID=UPI0013EDE371|nr:MULTISPECIES: hypothetical protein [unclassified Streptococcus]